MEITAENKARFFALYWGQFVLRLPNNSDELKVIDWFKFDEAHLELKNLADISDEDLMRVAELAFKNHAHQTPENGRFFIKELTNSETFFVNLGAVRYVIDFLRLRGYLIGFHDLSPEQIIQSGWAKYNKTVYCPVCRDPLVDGIVKNMCVNHQCATNNRRK